MKTRTYFLFAFCIFIFISYGATAQSVSNIYPGNGIFAAGQSFGVSVGYNSGLGQSAVYATGTNSTLALLGSGNAGILFNSGNSNGPLFVIGGASGPVTGRLNLLPGVGNAPIAFNFANSSNANQSLAFRASAGVGGQMIFSVPDMTGAYANPGSNSYNCGGHQGLVLVCNNNETLSGGSPVSLFVAKQFGGGATTGGRTAQEVSLVMTGATADIVNSFYSAEVVDSEMRANAGGTSGSYIGSNVTRGVYARLENGATNFLENASTEEDISVETGASVAKLHGHSVVLLSTNAVAPFIESTGYSVGAQVGATPTIQCAFCIGRYDGANGMAAGGVIMGILPPAYSGSGPTIIAGDDFRLASFSLGSFLSNGVTLSGSSVRIGRSFMTDAGGGLTITATGSVGTAATVQSGGSGYSTTLQNLTDAYGGIWEITGLSGGVVTGITMLSAPYVSGATPSNPIALTSPSGQPGSGATINVTWATGNGTTFVGTTSYTSIVKTTPSTGNTVTFAASQRTALIVPAGTLANLTLTLPACSSTNDGDERDAIFSQIVSSLTVNASAGSVVGASSAAGVGQGHAYHCYGADAAWYQKY